MGQMPKLKRAADCGRETFLWSLAARSRSVVDSTPKQPKKTRFAVEEEDEQVAKKGTRK